MDQEPRICPLCGSPVRLFFINFSEKLLMCEDPNCDFPFGYEELQIVTEESELRETFETASSISLGPYNCMSAASSVISTAAWSDIERLNRIYDSEDCTVDSRMSYTSDAVRQQRERRETQKEIQQNLDNIKELNTELNLLKHADRGIIEKDIWLKNLMNLQGLSGRQLLKENEIENLRKKEPDFGMGELKININTEPNDDGLINIEIINEDDELQNKNEYDTQENKIQIQLDEIDDMDENYNNDHEDNEIDKKVNLSNNQQVNTLNDSMNTDIQQTKEIGNHANNGINPEELPSSDTLPELNINLNEISNFVTDSDIRFDSGLVDVKTVVIENNTFTLIELKGNIQDIHSQNETKNITGVIQINSTNATLDTANGLSEENINKSNTNEQTEIESTQNQVTTFNNLIDENEGNILNHTNYNDLELSDNDLECRNVDENKESESCVINKEIKTLLETEKSLLNNDKNAPSNIVKTSFDDSNVLNKKLKKNENQEYTKDNSKKADLIVCSNYQEDKMNNSIESDLINISIKSNSVNNSKKSNLKNNFKLNSKINISKVEEDVLNNSIESKDEAKINKKRGRPRKGPKVQPVRRSTRLLSK